MLEIIWVSIRRPNKKKYYREIAWASWRSRSPAIPVFPELTSEKHQMSTLQNAQCHTLTTNKNANLNHLAWNSFPHYWLFVREIFSISLNKAFNKHSSWRRVGTPWRPCDANTVIWFQKQTYERRIYLNGIFNDMACRLESSSFDLFASVVLYAMT